MPIECLDGFQTSKSQCKLEFVPAGHFKGTFLLFSSAVKFVDIQPPNNSAHKLGLTTLFLILSTELLLSNMKARSQIEKSQERH